MATLQGHHIKEPKLYIGTVYSETVYHQQDINSQERNEERES